MSMAAYLTTAGLTVLNKVIASQGPLEFTKAELGSGVCSDEAACRARTSLVTKKTDAIISGARYEGGEAKISVQYVNTNLQTGFFVNEVGLYVKDPDTSAQVLYCYATFGDGSTPDWIAPASSATYTRVYDIATIIANVSSVTVNVSPSAMVSLADFEVFENKTEIAIMSIATECDMVSRDMQKKTETLDTKIDTEKASLQSEMRSLDDQQAGNDNLALLAVMSHYDAILMDLSSRLATAEAQLAAINT